MLRRARDSIFALATLALACSDRSESEPRAVEAATAAASLEVVESASAISAAPAPSASVTPPRPAPPDATAERFDKGAPDDWLPRASVRDAGFDGRAVDALIAAAIASESDSLLVIHDGRVIVERTFGRPRVPLETRSFTKSIACLAVLALIADGRIASVDVPLSTYFSEFASGQKALVTLRHVLTHSTGLSHGLTDADALTAQADRLSYARGLPVTTPPGTRFSYSNEATQLLSGIIAQASGKNAEEYVRERIFTPLGITHYEWKRDRSGGVQTYYGLQLTARDMAKVGLLLLDEGTFQGREIIPRELVRQAVAPSAVSLSYGWLFWRRSDLVQTPDRAADLAPFDGKVFRAEEEYFTEIASLVGAKGRDRVASLHRSGTAVLVERPGSDHGFYGVGGFGQRLAVYPRARIVAVRQHRRGPNDKKKEAKVTWRAFFTAVEAISPALAR